jgi:lipoprotein-anchoring transpeptidase ErfK/SrfK
MSTATGAERWALIDRTCQMMFIGSGEQLVFVFPTSTGSEGFETRDQDRANVFRYNPAVDNGGWHDSSEFPVGVDNPLNGNLYKPLYFDLGQAIHGANNVPPTPESKGCARLSVADQELLLSWLGLLDDVEETWRTKEINFTVNVQGEFVGR